MLLFALVLGLTALVASLRGPAEREDAEAPKGAREGPTAGPGATPPGAAVRRLRFDARKPAARRMVPRGTHLLVSVVVGKPGQVTLRGAGLVATAERRTPAVFDLLASRPGRLDLMIAPVEGRPRRVGTILVSQRRD